MIIKAPSPERLKDIKTLNEKAIEEICSNVYIKVAKLFQKDVDNIINMGICGTITAFILEDIKKEFPNAKAVNVYQSIGGAIHEFIELEMNGEVWILDATWQQFLPSRDKLKTSVLLVRKENIGDKLKELGIPSSHQHLWLEYRYNKYAN